MRKKFNGIWIKYKLIVASFPYMILEVTKDTSICSIHFTFGRKIEVVLLVISEMFHLLFSKTKCSFKNFN